MNNGFIDYDDQEYITNNLHLKRGITFEEIAWAFTTKYTGYFHPLTWLSYMLDYKLYGLNPMGYHCTNLQIHIANTILLFLVINVMTGALWRSAFIAALFALHPLNVESVAWIAERKNVLSTFFGLFAFIAYYRYVKNPCSFHYMLVIFFFVLSLLAKPMLVTLPFILLLLDFWPLGRLSFNSSQSSKEVFKRGLHLIREKLWFFIPVFISSVLTVWAQHSQGVVGSLTSYPIRARIFNALVSYIIYVYKVIWPRKLAVFYPYPDFIPAWQGIGAALLIIVCCYLAVRYSKKYAYLTVGLFWYLGTLIPVIGLVQVGEQAMADRYMYIPSIGIFIIAAWGVWDLLKKWYYRKTIYFVFVLIILPSIAIRSFIQVGYWKDTISLFENAINVTDNNYIAYNNIGSILSDQGMLDKAVKNFKTALKIKPDYVISLYALGTILAREKKYDKAMFYLNRVLNINPENVRAQNNIANIFFAQGKLDKAAYYYNQAIRFDPVFADAHYNLGCLLIEKKQFKEAMRHLAETIKINPNHAKAYNKIGILMAKMGKVNNATKFFIKAIQIDPNYFEARKHLEILRRSEIMGF